MNMPFEYFGGWSLDKTAIRDYLGLPNEDVTNLTLNQCTLYTYLMYHMIGWQGRTQRRRNAEITLYAS